MIIIDKIVIKNIEKICVATTQIFALQTQNYLNR